MVFMFMGIHSGHEKAKIESDFNYKACCNDNTGLQVLGTEVYQPSSCSQRTCFYDKYLPFSLWISKPVRKNSHTHKIKFFYLTEKKFD